MDGNIQSTMRIRHVKLTVLDVTLSTEEKEIQNEACHYILYSLHLCITG